jgi:hypothetical protein
MRRRQTMETTVLDRPQAPTTEAAGEAHADRLFFLKCVEGANLSILEHLCEAGSTMGSSPGAVIAAVRSGDIRVLDLILRSGGHADEKDSAGCPALVLAVRSLRMDLLTRLLTAGSSPDARDSEGQTALLVASCLGMHRGISALLEAKANPNATDVSGRTALMTAAAADQAEAAEALLNGGADAHLRDREGRTAFMLALMGGHATAAKVLRIGEPGSPRAPIASPPRTPAMKPRGTSRQMQERAPRGPSGAPRSGLFRIVFDWACRLGLRRGTSPATPFKAPALSPRATSMRSLQSGVRAIDACIRKNGISPASLQDVALGVPERLFSYKPFPNGHYVLRIAAGSEGLVHDSSKGPALVSFTIPNASRKRSLAGSNR